MEHESHPLRRGSKCRLQISLLASNVTSFQLICTHCTCLFFSSGCVFNRSPAACSRARSIPHLWTYSYYNTFGGKTMEEWKKYWNQEGNLSNVRQKWLCLLLTPCILNESPVFFHTVEKNGKISFPPTEHFPPTHKISRFKDDNPFPFFFFFCFSIMWWCHMTTVRHVTQLMWAVLCWISGGHAGMGAS